MRRGPGSEFFRFCIVGSIAFIADTTVLFALISLDLADVYARIASLAAGMHVAYFLNSHFTYRDHRGICVATWRAFVVSNFIGSLINYGVYLGIFSLALLPNVYGWRLISVVCGTGVALLFNHWANKRFAFRREPL